MNDDYKKCDKPDCGRKVKVGVLYCCAACALADERGHEVHETGPLAHSPGCEARHRDRGGVAL